MAPTLSRIACFLFASLLIVSSLLLIDRIGTKALQTRIGQSLDAIADSSRTSAEVLSDFDLPIIGPDSVEELLRPPQALAQGPDALALRIATPSTADPSKTVSGHPIRAGAMVVERPILDSHGEPVAHLVVSRSMAGFDDVAARRQLIIAITAVLAIASLAMPTMFKRRWRAVPPLAILVIGIAVLIVGFGSQSVDISRQNAAMVIADVSDKLGRARSLGIPFDGLVGMHEYLQLQTASRPNIGSIEVRGPGGVSYRASSDGVGSALTDHLQNIGIPSFGNLLIENQLDNGISLTTTIHIQPVLSEVALLALIFLVFSVCGAAMLPALWGSGKTKAIDTTLATSLLLLAVYCAWSNLPAFSTVPAWLQFSIIGLAFIPGVVIPRRSGVVVIVAVLACLGSIADGIYLLAGAATIGGWAFREFGKPKPVTFAASIFPALLVAGLQAMDNIPGSRFAPHVGLIVLVVIMAARSWLNRSSPLTQTDVAEAGTVRSATFDNWLWVFVFAMQSAGFVLLNLAALQMPTSVFGNSGPALYFCLCIAIYAIGGTVAALHATGRRVRWILYEVAVFAVVAVMAIAYTSDGVILISAGSAAFFMGAIGHWTSQLNLTMQARPLPARGVAAGELIAICVAGSIVTGMQHPVEASLPATLTYLTALAPLAFASLAAMSTKPRHELDTRTAP